MERLNAAEREFINKMAALTSSLGLGEAPGKIWAALLLYNRPLTQEELRGLTGYSTGIISLNLSLLESWGLVARTGKRGRRKAYRAVKSLSDLIESFLHGMADKQLSILIDFLQRNLGSFTEKTKDNATGLLQEFKRVRSTIKALALSIKGRPQIHINI